MSGVPKALAVYLADHFAGATFGVELVRRCRRNNEGSPFAAPLAGLQGEIEEDRAVLLALMRRLDVSPSLPKTLAAWGVEKARRLKPHGRPLAYTALARLAELEALASGIVAKRALWRTLDETWSGDDRIRPFNVRTLSERAERQLELVEGLRADAAALALPAPGSAAPAQKK